MANAMLKYLKFAQILNRQLSLISIKRSPGQYLYRSYTNTIYSKSYATAAYKVAANEDSGVRSHDGRSSKDGIQSVDDEIARIDSLIRRNGRTQMRNIHRIFSLLDSKETTSSLHGLYLLRSCKYCIDEPPSKRIEMVNEIWNRYQKLGIEFDVKHYNAMLDVHVANNLDFNPVEVLASMEDLKIEPNKGTYMLIMKKYCQDGNIGGASEILEYMKEKQMSIDEKVFNYLIEAHVNNKDLAEAKEIVDVMRSSNLEPTADTYAILACGYAVSGDKDEMMSHLRKCKSFDNIQNYLRVIETLARSGNHQYVDDVLFLIEYKNRFQQELINASVDLIHKNYDEIAYKLATASCTHFYSEGVNIFMKQLIKVGRDLSEVITYCERIKKEDLNPNIQSVAVRAFAEYGKIDQAAQIFRKFEELGYCVRPGTFWPFFTSLKEHKPSEGCWLILKSMTELGVPCDFKTYTEYVYPALGMQKPDVVLKGIKLSGQALDMAADALFVYYCDLGAIDYALELTEKVPITMSSKLDVQNLVRLYQDISVADTPKYYKILKYIFKDDDVSRKCDVQGKLLAELILFKRRLLEILLEKFDDLKFSDYTFYICEMELRERNPSRIAYLMRIKEFNAENRSLNKDENISEEEEDKYISQLQAENISFRPFLIKRILHHTRTKNISRVQQLLLTFDELQYEYTPFMLSNLFGLWCSATDVVKAKETLDKIKIHFPDFQIDLPKALEYAALLVKYEKFDESYETLKNILEKPHFYPSKDFLNRSIKRFNQTLSHTQNPEFVKKMQTLILPLSKELGTKKTLLDASVQIHLLKNDLKSALEEFRNIVVSHRVPACLNHFLRKCINSNEKDILQQVVDLTISCSGKSYALLELAVAFIETFNIQKAAKVIENLGSQADRTVVDNLCVKLWQQNKLTELENLIYITEPLKHLDRENLYCHAFKAYASINDFDRVLQLYESLKKEVGEPKSETVQLLHDLLKKNNQTLPLSLVSQSPSEISPSEISPSYAEATKPFLEHLEAGDSEAALNELSSLKKGYIRTLSIKTLTDLVDLCLQKNCVQTLSLNVHTMSYIFEHMKEVLKPIMEKYSEAGDVEKFNLLLSVMPDFSLMGIGFNSYFCKAFINSGKYEDLLSRLEERAALKNKLFSIAAFEELLKLPEYEEKVFSLAIKYLESDFKMPMTVVWAHYFSKENYEKAEELYKKFSPSAERADVVIFRSIKQHENVDLAKKYIDFIKSSDARDRAKERAYGVALDLLVSKGLYDEAADLVVDAEKQNLQLHKYYLSTLVTLKSILEKENKPVPFNVPLDTASSSSTDSEK